MFCGLRERHDHDATFRGEVNFDEAPQIFTAWEIARSAGALRLHGGAVEFNAGQFIQPIHQRLLVSINLVEKLQFGRRKFRSGRPLAYVGRDYLLARGRNFIELFGITGEADQKEADLRIRIAPARNRPVSNR
jgi:hypothetical protein